MQVLLQVLETAIFFWPRDLVLCSVSSCSDLWRRVRSCPRYQMRLLFFYGCCSALIIPGFLPQRVEIEVWPLERDVLAERYANLTAKMSGKGGEGFRVLGF